MSYKWTEDLAVAVALLGRYNFSVSESDGRRGWDGSEKGNGEGTLGEVKEVTDRVECPSECGGVLLFGHRLHRTSR